MQARNVLAAVALTVTSLLIPRTVSATTLTSTDVLQLSFTTSGSYGSFTPNTLEFYFFPGGVSSTGVTGYGAELYDGSTLLGSYHESGPLNGFIVPLFKSSASPVTSLSPTVVNFTTILNGTINGRIDFHLDSGSATYTAIRAFLFDATLADGGGVFSDQWTTSSLQVVPGSSSAVPEPTSLLLLGTGLVSAGIRRYRQRS